MNDSLEKAVLYGIVDLGYVSQADLRRACEELIRGGVGVIQLRAKGHREAEVLHWGRELLPLCRSAGVPFIVNDFPEVAKELDADGVHIGQDDGSLEETREVVGEAMLVGRSTHSVEQARLALEEGFDYIGFGPLFPTPTKAGRPGIGIENVSLVQEEVGAKIPVFCIGGIRRDNLALVRESGAKRVVIVSDVLLADDTEKAAREVVSQLSGSSF